ncbi:MAG: hypothetical protein V4617_01010 [Gemmatimonadota bacterium]
MSSASSAARSRAMSGKGILALLLLWLVLLFAIRFYLEAHPELASGIRLALAFVPVPVFALALWKFMGAIREADELERRIQLEALGLAFPLGLLLLTTLGLVQRAVELNFQDWSYAHVSWMFFVLYLGSLVVARRRYA